MNSRPIRLLLAVLILVAGFVSQARAQEQQLVGDSLRTEKLFVCDRTAAVAVAASATGVIVALITGGRAARICAMYLSADTTATTAILSYGTGTTCGTGNVALSGGIRFVDETEHAYVAPRGASVIRVPAGKDFCLAAATGAISGFVSYAYMTP